MMKIVVVAASIMVVGFAVVALAGVEVKSDEKNIVVPRIGGAWVPHDDLSQRLTGGKIDKEFPKEEKIEFIIDEAVAKKIPEKYDEFFKDYRVYAAGTMKFKGAELPFVLIALGGCPHVVFFRERGGDPMGDTESFYVMLAAAKDKSKDLLFIGGDMPASTFAAFQRAAE
jgi:hypothetical protein